MKFDEEHPQAFTHFTTADGFMKGSGLASECAYCEEPTTWFQKAADLHFCSRHCYESYVAALRAADRV